MKYERLEVEVIKFSTEDVIATSINPNTCGKKSSQSGEACHGKSTQQA